MKQHSNSVLWRDVATPYLLAQVLTAVALSMPHAILTPLLLGKGLSLSQILVVQAAFSVSVLLCEFPSGAIADLFSRRWVYVLSRVILCVFFLLVVIGASFPVLILAWFIYGIASALDTGTLDAALVNNAKNRGKGTEATERRVSWLVRKESQSNFAGMMVGSVVGSVLFLRIGVNIYLISVAAVVLAVVTVLVFFRIPEQHRVARESRMGFRAEFRAHVGATLSELRESPRLRHFLVLTVLVQAFMQVHMQLWQALALEKGFSVSRLVFLYVAFMAISFVSSYVRTERIFQHPWVVAGATVLFVGCAILLCVVHSRGYVVFYVALVVMLVVLSNYCAASVRASSSIERIGAVTSLVSVCGRVGSITMLLVASLCIRFVSATAVVSGSFVALVVLALAWLAAGALAGRTGHN